MEKGAQRMHRVLSRRVEIMLSFEKGYIIYIQFLFKKTKITRLLKKNEHSLCRGAYSEGKNHNVYPTALDFGKKLIRIFKSFFTVFLAQDLAEFS